MAWDGFDADSTALVEVIPDDIPRVGDIITLKNRDENTEEQCIVSSVHHNASTVEIVVKLVNGSEHTLVMEGK